MASLSTSRHHYRSTSIVEFGSRSIFPILPPKSSTSLPRQFASPSWRAKKVNCPVFLETKDKVFTWSRWVRCEALTLVVGRRIRELHSQTFYYGRGTTRRVQSPARLCSRECKFRPS